MDANNFDPKAFKNVIPVSPWIVKICNNKSNSALLLTQILYWTGKDTKNIKKNDGWTYQSFADLENQTGLTTRGLRTAQDNLLKDNLTFCKTEVASGHNTTWWKPNRNEIFKRVLEAIANECREAFVKNDKWDEEHLLETTNSICQYGQEHLSEATNYTNPILNLLLNPLNTNPSFNRDINLEEVNTEKDTSPVNEINKGKDISPVKSMLEVKTSFAPLADTVSTYVGSTGTNSVANDYANPISQTDFGNIVFPDADEVSDVVIQKRIERIQEAVEKGWLTFENAVNYYTGLYKTEEGIEEIESVFR